MRKNKAVLSVMLCLTILISGFFPLTVYGEGEAPAGPKDLHAKAAVLMDGESGRVLYGVNENEQLPMASTTKVMTLLVTLENASLDDVVTVSAYAASMPDVQLNIRAGEQYVLRDLVYSLMLESHNDSAVAIAEHVAGSVEAFAALMNERAQSLGCEYTYFITPNGLDASDANGTHSTTATELARIMSEAVKNTEFLSITQTMAHSFSNIAGTRSFSVNNKNALFSMMDGVLSGKTGFTNNAGFCYVGAINSNGRVFVVALLSCGWPPNKSWKWSDAQKLLNYGKDNYEIRTFGENEMTLSEIAVIQGQENAVKLYSPTEEVSMLARADEQMALDYQIMTQADAPIEKGACAGAIQYRIDDTIIKSYPVYFSETIEKVDFLYCIQKVLNNWLIR